MKPKQRKHKRKPRTYWIMQNLRTGAICIFGFQKPMIHPGEYEDGWRTIPFLEQPALNKERSES